MRTLPTASALLAILTLATGASGGAIYLKSETIDTQAGAQVSAAEPQLLGAGYYLVKLKGPVRDEHKRALNAAGAELVEYIPDFAFIVRAEHRRVAELRKLACVEWVGPFKPAYKRVAKASAVSRAERFIVRLFPGENADFVLKKAKSYGAKRIACAGQRGGASCLILANRTQLDRLAQMNAVAWIEPYVQPKLCNNVSEGICGVPDARQNLGLYGSGQIIGVSDNGLDTGSLSTISPDFSGRIQRTYALRRPNDWSDLNGHGTHVIGSALGAGVLSGSNPVTHNYTNSFAGYAPEARLVFQSIGDAGDFVFPPLHLAELFQPAYDDGVRVHSNSWGSAVKGQYTTYSNEVDQFIWDHKDFTAVFAVGNDAEDIDMNGVIDKDNIYAPATAKNCIAVGATENLRASGGYQMGYGVAWPGSYPASPIKYDLVSNNPNGMAAFSSRGPTDDGRTKPDICAPGTNIVSCRTHGVAGVTGWALYDANYIYWGGTSMSTPQVGGAAALVREYYQEQKGIGASAALVKATLLNGAVDTSPGQYGVAQFRELYPVPDDSQGWGRLNLKQSLFPDPPTVSEFTEESAGVSTNELREYHYTVVDNSVPLRATLVWSDYPGAVLAAKELVNDLDLTIISPTGAIYPFPGPTDRTNNVELIKIPGPELGVYRICVQGYNVPMGPQDYALVVSGGLPNTYISGTVRSTSGAGVQGVLVNIVAGGTTKRLTTSSSGAYITHVESGAYSVQVGKPGWTFTPRSRIVQVAGSPVENVDFQGSGKPGSISGTIRSAVGGVVSQIVESPHPYLNNFDKTYTITAREDATRVRVHFAEIDLMNDGDTVYTLDQSDAIVDTYTFRGEDIWSSWVNGHVIKIRIVTNDYGNTGYGFYADGYETDLIDQGAVGGVSVSLSPGGYQATTSDTGVYSISSVPPGTYTATPKRPHWKFQPSSTAVDVPANDALSGVDFTGFPPGAVSGEVRITSSEIHGISIESDHPYDNNLEQTWQIDGGPSANRIRLHFSRISTEPAWDFVYLVDGSDSVIEAYTAECEDLWTPWISGRLAKIELSTDSGGEPYYGFKCDSHEVQTVGAGLHGVAVDLSPDGRQIASSELGAFRFDDVEIGLHSAVASLDLWSFDPSSAQLSISAGTEQHVFFYACVTDLSSPRQAKFIADGIQVILKNVRISARFSGFFYVQKLDRSSGIRVDWPGQVSEGSLADVRGTMATVSGERKIIATGVKAL